MSRVTYILFAVSLAISSVGWAQNLRITGSAPELAGERILLLGEKDPVSRAIEVLADDTVSEENEFYLEAEIDRPQLLTLYSNYTRGTWMATGGKYQLVFPELGKDQVRTISGNTRVDLQIEEAPNSDLNSALSLYVTRYAQFVDTAARSLGGWRGKALVSTFIDSIRSSFPEPGDYLESYLKYRLAELKVGNGWKNTTVYDEYLGEEELPFANEGFLSFIETFYADYFETHIRKFGPEALMKTVNGEGSWDDLSELLGRDDFLAREDVRRLVAAISIRNAFGSPRFEPTRLVELLDEMATEEPTERKSWYMNLVEELKRGRVPFAAQPLNVLDSQGKSVNLPDTGSYTLIQFTASWCTDCRRSEVLLDDYTNRFEHIDFVSVVTDDTREGFQSIAENAGKTRKVIWAPDGFIARRNYRVPSLPYVVLIDPDGNLVDAPHNTGTQLEKTLFELNKRIQRNKKDDKPFSIGGGPNR